MQASLQVFENCLLLPFNTVSNFDDCLVLQFVEAVTWLEAPLRDCLWVAFRITAAGMITAVRSQITSAGAEVYHKKIIV